MKRNKNITLDYDEEADVLYMSFGSPKSAITEEYGNIGVRIDEESDEIIGFTVIDFLKTFKHKHKPIVVTV